jgi:GNAT superfamily N-acetyltransferase
MSAMAYPLVDQALAVRLEAAEGATSCRFVTARRALDPGGGAEWLEVDGAHAIYDGPGSPLNQSFGLGMRSAVTDGTLEALEAFFAGHGVPSEHEVSPLALGEPLAVLSRRGYEPFELTSLMFQPTDGPPLPAAPAAGLAVRVIAADEAVAWAEVAADGWSDTPEVMPFVRAIGDVYARMPDAQCFLVESDGRPAAAGVLAMHEGIALLAGASTRPAHRRKGAQLALLGARLAAARRHGCDLAVMAARPGSASQRNAERHGFRIAYTRIKWRKINR